MVRANGTPESLCVALTWETADADAALVRETVANVDEVVSLRVAFEDAEDADAGDAGESYALQCVLCYYGEHYCAFAISSDAKPVGAWGDVRAACEKGRLQPCVLFYRKTTRGEV